MWSWDHVWEILPDLLRALRITIAATFAGFAVAAGFGLLLILMRRSRNKLLAGLTGVFLSFVRNTPLLVQLFFLFYVLPVMTGISWPAFAIGVIGLGLHYGTYMSEVYRSGIDAVARGQWEAARALNFTVFQTWRLIVLPQAIPPILPIMGNYLIVMFKETPLLSAITLVELLAAAKQIVSESFRGLEAFTLVGLLFLLVSYPSSLAVRKIEQRISNLGGGHTR